MWGNLQKIMSEVTSVLPLSKIRRISAGDSPLVPRMENISIYSGVMKRWEMVPTTASESVASALERWVPLRLNSLGTPQYVRAAISTAGSAFMRS